MPNNKKPRKPKSSRPAPRKSPVELLIDDISAALDTGDLERFDLTRTGLKSLSRGDPTLDAAFFDGLDGLRAELAHSIAIADDVNAALWVGDMKRVQALEQANQPDTETDDDPDLENYFAEADPYGDLAKGKPGALDTLLATGADLNQIAGPDERPALFAAIEAPARNADTLQRLIAAGANPKQYLDDERSLISWALMYDHYDTVTPDSEKALFDLIFASGAEVNDECGDFGHNLIAAIILGGAPQVAALLQAGADLTVTAPDDFQLPDLEGATPLMLAAPKPGVVTLLLAHGADPAARDENGRSTLEFISDAATLAESRATDDWSRGHAAALQQSLALIRAALHP